MKLTKHAHACVELDKDGGRLVIDPGTLTPDAARVIAGTGSDMYSCITGGIGGLAAGRQTSGCV